MESILQVKVSRSICPSGTNLLLPGAWSFGDFLVGSNSRNAKILECWWVSRLFELFTYDTHEQIIFLEEESTLNLGMQHSMRLFRAQRNFYISGFAIFLSLVIRRLIILISQQATLIANSEASMRQAKSASDTARKMMSEQDTKKTDDPKVDEEKVALKDVIRNLEDELKREKKDKEAIKSQAESLNREYDRLTEEFSKLQNKSAKAGGDKAD